jgi:SAM-dependent methyltransferase
MNLRSCVKSAIPRPLEPLVRSVLTRYRLARGPLRSRERALRLEVEFWERWIRRGGVNLEERLANTLTDSAVVHCISRIDETEVMILDVGAGPLTTLGTDFPGKRIALTAVDPLADEYDQVLRECDITPPVITTLCAGEDLVKRFGPDHFDIAFSENALDHTPEPLTILQTMLAVVKPGRYVVLNHFHNEGDHASYGQLHQWNFDERAGRCWLWRDREHYDLSEILFGKATIECWRERRSREVRERVLCIITRDRR